jgi:hypothetical protein
VEGTGFSFFDLLGVENGEWSLEISDREWRMEIRD